MTASPSVDVHGNKRVRMGMFLAPLIAGLMWKAAALFVVPITVVLVMVVGLPLLERLKKRGSIQWWHAVLVGLVTGGAVTILYWLSADRFHFEIAGPENAAWIVAYGAAVAFLFWIIAIFNNPIFLQRRTIWPLLVVTVGLLGWGVLHFTSRLEVGKAQGIVRSSPEVKAGLGYVSIELKDGSMASARVDGETAQRIRVGREVSMHTRLAVASENKLYWLSGLCRDPAEKSPKFKPC